MKVSRRTLARTLLTAAAGATLQAQAPQPVSPDVELEQARAQLRTAAQIVRAVPLSMSTEPAMRFQPRT
jgi:hypothetical protein